MKKRQRGNKKGENKQRGTNSIETHRGKPQTCKTKTFFVYSVDNVHL